MFAYILDIDIHDSVPGLLQSVEALYEYKNLPGMLNVDYFF